MDPSGKGPPGRDVTEGSLEDITSAWGSLDDEALLYDEDFIQRILDEEDDIELPEECFLDGEAPLEVLSEDFFDQPLTEQDEAELAEQTLERFEEQEQKRESLYVRVKTMAVGQKIKLALKGGREARNILMRDSNKVIRRLVLRNPRISEDEIAIIARNRSEDSEFLDFISKRKEWVKNYQIRLALVTNPKTPPPLALRLVNTLLDRNLRQIAKSKNVPMLVCSAAKRILFKRQRGEG